jgi:hypothetical protein
LISCCYWWAPRPALMADSYWLPMPSHKQQFCVAAICCYQHLYFLVI